MEYYITLYHLHLFSLTHSSASNSRQTLSCLKAHPCSVSCHSEGATCLWDGGRRRDGSVMKCMSIAVLKSHISCMQIASWISCILLRMLHHFEEDDTVCASYTSHLSKHASISLYPFQSNHPLFRLALPVNGRLHSFLPLSGLLLSSWRPGEDAPPSAPYCKRTYSSGVQCNN